MAYDGFVTHCIVSELNDKIVGGKIDKIYQPERDEIILSIRVGGSVHRLLMSASSQSPRVHFTEDRRENPMTAPMFCMFLRKHLGGGKITSVSQEGFDRVMRIETECYDELGDLKTKSLICEIMGRHSNIILVDQDGKILDSIKRVDFTVSAVRQILSGLYYELPPKQDKLSPQEANLSEITEAIRRAADENADIMLDKWLVSAFVGMSPLLARELCFTFAGNTKLAVREVDTEKFALHIKSFFDRVCGGDFSPCVVNDLNMPKEFSCVEILQYGGAFETVKFDSMSAAADMYYSSRSSQEHIRQRSASLVKLLVNNIERCEKKLAIHRENLEEAKDRDKYKVCGDLLTANLYKIEYGMTSVEVLNYYSENGETIKIDLKPDLSPSRNAQRYYTLYNKAKTTERTSAEQIEIAEKEKYYLETVLESVYMAKTRGELAEIREELASQGYVPKQSGKKKQQSRSKPMEFKSSDGFTILVGRNNRQNDELTLRTAYSTDIWMHTKFIPGSHTIVRTEGKGEAPDTTLIEAATLAAFFSKARLSSNVPVDYTTVKNVKKPNGAKPGMVIYDFYNTIYVTPNENLAKKLSAEKYNG